jgi:hypothetical protein
VCKHAQKHAHEHTGSAEAIRPSLRNGFTAYSALSSATGFVATVIGGILPANLTPASGRQNHTPSPSAREPFVKGTVASTASRPYVRDDRERPSVWDGIARAGSADLPDGGSGIFFARGLDRANQIEMVQQIRFYTHGPESDRQTSLTGRRSKWTIRIEPTILAYLTSIDAKEEIP